MGDFFVLQTYRGRCPASPQENKEKAFSETSIEQGKETDEHLMRLGDWLRLYRL